MERDVGRRRIARLRLFNGKQQAMIHGKTRIDAGQVEERARKENGANDEDGRKHQLKTDDGFASETPAAAGGGLCCFLEAGADLIACRGERGRHPEEKTRGQRDDGGERKDTPVEMELGVRSL